ncbi:sporulation protein YabP [Natranaerobius thermophilus]|uniref:Sporulation protein YabP n=1 Tax=Natranaerobius thermophilus (strain ATCC BAA-1301 / DSM 18059 / JW/NM-WN-LF) TaxID=457570 RepID=B2A3P5_NATTJ|nr:sporulation protein YabP [Natranaerobius thermophilus]ACB83671.1 sporulation protein YabP [Natranaerobius thermophilus JW/NM-WN-LF]
MEERLEETSHKLIITDREYTEITGVLHVDSFDEEEIVLETELGLLALRGEKLDIKELNLDDKLLTVEGVILEAAYSDEASPQDRGKGIFSRIFR